MRPSLTLKIGQQLRMTPQLQQAIKLLQLSTLDLQQEIQEALDSNLMLEEFDDTAETAAASDADTLDETTRLDNPSEADNSDAADPGQGPDEDFEGPSSNEFETLVADPHDQELDGDRVSDTSELLQTDALGDDLPVDSIWEDVYDSLPTGLGAGASFDEDGESFDARNSPQGTAQSHLLEQINLLNFTETDEVIALHIIDGLDHEGML
ncbi:RNA polymerase factor sigma-54, partial [Pseudomonadales bacterium]|nr:RNA polymerase factor sigma-54 [Pseudomonadales bacterium]